MSATTLPFLYKRTLGHSRKEASSFKKAGTRYNGSLAKINRAIKIANARNQGKAKSEAISAIAATFRENAKPFNKANNMLNKDTFA